MGTPPGGSVAVSTVAMHAATCCWLWLLYGLGYDARCGVHTCNPRMCIVRDAFAGTRLSGQSEGLAIDQPSTRRGWSRPGLCVRAAGCEKHGGCSIYGRAAKATKRLWLSKSFAGRLMYKAHCQDNYFISELPCLPAGGQFCELPHVFHHCVTSISRAGSDTSIV